MIINGEFCSLYFNLIDYQKEITILGIAKFWEMKKSKFKILAGIAIKCLTLPYSTCGVERTFSMLNDIKTTRRNRLKVHRV